MGMIERHGEGAAHQAVAAEGAVKARQSAHFEDLAYAVALFTQQPAAGVNKLRFAAGVRTVAELLFEPLEAHAVTLPVRQKARHKEAGEAARRLRQH